MNNENITSLTIQQLLSENKYVIPIYQRNYDWGEKETLQLIEDIADYAQNSQSRYYIGSVVVYVRYNNSDEYFETIDGQQRLTTLTILVSALKNMDGFSESLSWFSKPNLSYDHRLESDKALMELIENRIPHHPSVENISEVYKIIKKNLLNILKEKNINIASFVKYLLSNVIILRIPVPKDTDINHYFEIMNSRGEQLEKHEVLKATLMSYLEKDKDVICLFNDIWEACSDMNTYVQMKFSPQMRSVLFTNEWNVLQYSDFESILHEYKDLNNYIEDNNNGDDYACRSLAQLFDDAKNNIKYELSDIDNDSDGANDRFGSIINFPNFLLQILKITYQNNEEYEESIDDNIKLDDKRLIEFFHLVLESCIDKCKFVKNFIVSLLTIRVLFDYYIIKRENFNGKERWSIKMPKKYDKNVNYIGTFSHDDVEDYISKDIRMIEAMFHVSAPTQTYKHWLNATLFYLHKTYDQNNGYIDATEMRNHLYQLARTFMLDRYLTTEKIDFEKIIYENNCMPKNHDIDWSLINNGCGVENFIFNFYDYIIWKQDFGQANRFYKFEFTYRTSVEHFYPQTPQIGHEVLTQETGLNDFGNLCLISRGMNSRFSNNMPIAKVENFGKEEALNELSIKLIEMMDIVRKTGRWSTSEINDFEKKAKICIENALK